MKILIDKLSFVCYGGGMIGLMDIDKKGPNLALMKLKAFYGQGAEWVRSDVPYEVIFASKVFSYTKDICGPEEGFVRGGSASGSNVELPDIIEHICPDYNLYGLDYSLGFLTRGCIRNCPWCVVPQKEGRIRANADVEEFLRHDKVVLVDNNVLAHSHGIGQIEKLVMLGVKVDFNQGLDARLIDNGIARRLAKLRWLRPVRLACDHKSQMESVLKAVTLLRWHNTTPRRFFCYVLVKDVEDAFERVKFLKGIYVEPFAQPYIAPDGSVMPTVEQKKFARWVNVTSVFNSVSWEDYRYRDGRESL